jgi:hypothetical protein
MAESVADAFGASGKPGAVAAQARGNAREFRTVRLQ